MGQPPESKLSAGGRGRLFGARLWWGVVVAILAILLALLLVFEGGDGGPFIYNIF